MVAIIAVIAVTAGAANIHCLQVVRQYVNLSIYDRLEACRG